MIRTQIQLTEEQHRLLTRWAKRLGISLAEAVRRCVADRLAAERVETGRGAIVAQAMSVIGKYGGQPGEGSVARNHDAHLTREYAK